MCLVKRSDECHSPHLNVSIHVKWITPQQRWDINRCECEYVLMRPRARRPLHRSPVERLTECDWYNGVYRLAGVCASVKHTTQHAALLARRELWSEHRFPAAHPAIVCCCSRAHIQWLCQRDNIIIISQSRAEARMQNNKHNKHINQSVWLPLFYLHVSCFHFIPTNNNVRMSWISHNKPKQNGNDDGDG